jgi:hypothetical protein
MSYKSTAFVSSVLACGLLSMANSASAMSLSYERTGSGTVASGNQTTYSNTHTTSDSYGNSAFSDPAVFGQPTAPFFTDPHTGVSYGFYDDFVFTIGNGTVDSITSTINLGTLSAISDLSVRLYNASQSAPLPVLATPDGGAIDAWSNSMTFAPGLTGTVDVLSPKTLAAGTYVLEVRGNVTGTGGGSYAGTLNLTPVPLPAALPFLLSGLGIFGGLSRRLRLSATAHGGRVAHSR